MADEPIDIVQRFCDAWGNVELDELLDYFTQDALYHNIPLDPHHGVDEIRGAIEAFMGGVEKITFRTDHIAASGNVVLTERVDSFVMPEKTIDIPVMGTFEVTDDGKISAWRDYFDLNQFMSQMPQG